MVTPTRPWPKPTAKPTYYPRGHVYPWVKWFAWHPIQLKDGSWLWLKTIYRRLDTRYKYFNNWEAYEYGSIFDILKEEHTESDGSDGP